MYYVITQFLRANVGLTLRQYNINDYPSIKKHLDYYWDKIQQRSDQGSTPYNLRSCAYIEEIESEKIVFSEIVSEPQFHYDSEGYYPEATVFFITGKKLKYLLALLNSKPLTFFFKTFYMGGELVGKIRYKKAFLEQVPIPVPNMEQENAIIDLVNQILALKQSDPTADTSDLENQIDKLVYDLYGLSEEEIKIVEGR
jgi:adenine-specific DNA-methyltransferase